MAKHKYLVLIQCVVKIPIYVDSEEELDPESLVDKAAEQTGKPLEDKVNEALSDIRGRFGYLKSEEDWQLKEFDPIFDGYVEI
jgi:hypothetical protein